MNRGAISTAVLSAVLALTIGAGVADHLSSSQQRRQMSVCLSQYRAAAAAMADARGRLSNAVTALRWTDTADLASYIDDVDQATVEANAASRALDTATAALPSGCRS